MPIIKQFTNRLLHHIARVSPGSTSIRPFLHRLRGVSIGSSVFIGEDVYLENEHPELITIGNNVQIALRSVLIAHIMGKGKIIIEDNAYIGAACVITCGPNQELVIGTGSVVGAGSIVTSSVSAHSFVRSTKPKVVAKVGRPIPLCNSFDEFLNGLSLPK